MLEKRRTIKRRRRLRISNGKDTPESAVERADKTAFSYIMQHTFRDQILSAIRQNISNTEIARDFITKGYFNVNEKTAVQYLQRFRKAHPDLCKPVENESIPGYDHLFGEDTPSQNPEAELMKLIKLQKARIARSYNLEDSMSMNLKETHKEIITLNELINSLMKVKGISANNANIAFNVVGADVKADLRDIKQEEQQKDALASLVGDLLETVNAD